MRAKGIRTLIFFSLISIVCICLYRYGRDQRATLQRFPTSDERFLQPFLNGKPVSREDFSELVTYFQDGFIAYKEPEGSLALYPGLPSNHPSIADRMEAFSRVAPLLAVWLRNNTFTDALQVQRTRKLLIDGITHGTDPKSPGYWGQYKTSDQRIVEASDVALSIWLSRGSLWLQLSHQTQDNVIRWLLQVNNKLVPDNNWHLFVTFVNLVVDSLGYEADMKGAQEHYARFRQFYRGSGWFSDGPGVRFDYYNAWAIHYQLFWIDQVRPSFDHSFIIAVLDEFANQFQYFISPDGIPILGRSICYRMAISTPLILDQELQRPSVPHGVARRALDVTWQYFIRNGGVSDGNMTQGYCAADARVLDNYSGPASCLWGLRSLISAFYLAPSTPFWAEPEQPLPVERADYLIQLPSIGWTVRGTKPGVIVVMKTSGLEPASLKAENFLLASFDRLTKGAHRPSNDVLKYDLREYRSDRPFCDCVRPR